MSDGVITPIDLGKADLDSIAELQLQTNKEHQARLPEFFEDTSLDVLRAEIEPFLPG